MENVRKYRNFGVLKWKTLAWEIFTQIHPQGHMEAAATMVQWRPGCLSVWYQNLLHHASFIGMQDTTMTESSRLAPRSLKTLGNVWKDQILWVELSSGLCITLRKWSLHVRRDSRISEMTDMWDICWEKKMELGQECRQKNCRGEAPQAC